MCAHNNNNNKTKTGVYNNNKKTQKLVYICVKGCLDKYISIIT